MCPLFPVVARCPIFSSVSVLAVLTLLLPLSLSALFSSCSPVFSHNSVFSIFSLLFTNLFHFVPLCRCRLVHVFFLVRVFVFSPCRGFLIHLSLFVMFSTFSVFHVFHSIFSLFPSFRRFFKDSPFSSLLLSFFPFFSSFLFLPFSLFPFSSLCCLPSSLNNGQNTAHLTAHLYKIVIEQFYQFATIGTNRRSLEHLQSLKCQSRRRAQKHYHFSDAFVVHHTSTDLPCAIRMSR